MVSIKTRSRLTADGTLDIRVPTGLPESEVEVVVVVQPVSSELARKSPEDLGWPPGFFERTFGAITDDSLTRHSQGAFEVRDELL